MSELNDDECNNWALICAAHGLDDLVERFLVDAPPASHPVSLARTIIETPDDDAVVRTAWDSFVAGFPFAYDENGVQLSSL